MTDALCFGIRSCEERPNVCDEDATFELLRLRSRRISREITSLRHAKKVIAGISTDEKNVYKVYKIDQLIG